MIPEKIIMTEASFALASLFVIACFEKKAFSIHHKIALIFFTIAITLTAHPTIILSFNQATDEKIKPIIDDLQSVAVWAGISIIAGITALICHKAKYLGFFLLCTFIVGYAASSTSQLSQLIKESDKPASSQ